MTGALLAVVLLVVFAEPRRDRRRRRKPRPRKVGGARGYFSLNLPGQDVKAGRRLIARPLRYRLLMRRLQAGRYDAGVLQESTYQARQAFALHPRWRSYAGPTNEHNGVGNAVVWRSDRLRDLRHGSIRLAWDGASRGALFLPWVELQPRRGGPSFVLVAGHLPYAGYRGATTEVREAMSIIVAASLRSFGDWLAGFDWNSRALGAVTARRANGRTVSQHGVDSLIGSETFDARRPRAIVAGIMWRFGDHPMITVRGRWTHRD